MLLLVALFLATFLITFIANPTMGADWSWDFFNGLGFATLAGMLYLMVPVTHRRAIRSHELLAYAVVGVAASHALWFLLRDGAVVEYLKPGTPTYMWSGTVGLVVLFLTVLLSALPTRLKLYREPQTFKLWHRSMAWAAVFASAYHIVGTRYYLSAWFQTAALLILLGLVAVDSPLRRLLQRPTQATPAAYLALSVVTAVLFAAIRNIRP